MKEYFKVLSKFLFCYYIASVALTIYLRWSNLFESHAHVPFSGISGILIFAPVMPFAMFDDITTLLVGGGIFFTVFLAVYNYSKILTYFSRKRN